MTGLLKCLGLVALLIACLVMLAIANGSYGRD